MRPVIASISLSAFAHNLAVVRQLVPTAQLHAVVKANAYGHGVDRLFPAFDGADGLALIELDTAIRLRERLGWQRPLLILEGFYEASELRAFSEYSIDAVVHEPGQVALLERMPLPKPIRVYVKFNTGMNRLGFPMAQAHAISRRLQTCGNVSEIVLTTHFARADEPDGFRAQLEAFDQATRGITARRSFANSGAVVQLGMDAGDVIRPGIMLYGGTPMQGRSAASFGLKAVMRLHSRVIAIQNVKAGMTVGYGGTDVAPTDMRVAVVAGGYADGYLRSARNGTPVLIDGVRAPLFGRVSMDKITVDVSQVPTAQVGSEVELWGDRLPVDEVAASAGSISYELLTAVSSRVRFETV